MTTPSAAETALRDGDPRAALARLQEQVRANPSDAKLRIFLFQLLAVLGEYERALNQLAVSAQLDASAIAMAQTYREAIRCEVFRREVFAGRRTPMIFGQPEPWTVQLTDALARDAEGRHDAAADLRAQAFEAAPAEPGSADGKPFAWIADADPRLGPLLEVIVNGNYYWMPFSQLAKLEIEAPEDLRDAVWTPAKLVFVNGGGSVALIPTRYPGTDVSGDGALQLGRRTEWAEPLPGLFTGLGQRLFTTDDGDVALHDLRCVEWTRADAADAADAAPVAAD